jgi:hypothetical protein
MPQLTLTGALLGCVVTLLHASHTLASDSPTAQPTQSPSQSPTLYDAQFRRAPTDAPTASAPPTWAPTSSPTIMCLNVVDLAIITDGSSSVTETNFELVKTFAKNIFASFSIGDGDTFSRGALIRFSTATSVMANFAPTGSNAVSLQDAVTNTAFQGGYTGTPLALNQANTAVFNTANGMRVDSLNIPRVCH